MCYFCVKIRSWDKCVDPGAKWCLKEDFDWIFWTFLKAPTKTYSKKSPHFSMEVLSSRPITGVVVKNLTQPSHSTVWRNCGGELSHGFWLGGVSPSSNFFLPETWRGLEKKDGKKLCEWWKYHGSLRFKVDCKIKLTALQFAPFWGRNLISGVIIWPYPTCLLRFTCQR